MKNITLRASGKINLTLDILGKRPDGYHDVEMVMQSIELSDEITLTRTTGELYVETDNPSVPKGLDNIALRAAYLLKERFNTEAGVDIFIKKNIPAAAGLAGGSTDCAAVLVGLNELWGLGLSLEHLISLGAELGADVPFCITGGTALARGIGERIFPRQPAAGIWVVLVKPEVEVSTAEVYNSMDLNAIKNRPRPEGVLKALKTRDFNTLRSCMGNVMETVTAKRYPVIEFLKVRLISEGAAASMMTGSGPTVFGIFENEETALNAFTSLKDEFSEVYLTRTTAQGITKY